MNHGLPYKPYIDGLRAVAVLGVVLNHFKPSVLLGGFIGVDVFFVISGFLLSGAILRGLDRGDFSLASFYVRRIRRIIPSASFALILVIVAGFFVLLPQELHRLSLSALYTVLFAANFFFYANVDYFSPAADQMPLLHYWSLGVEEQFYLIFPLAIIIIRKIWPSSVVYAVIYLCILSFGASIIILSRDQTAAFYILPFRAFEFLIGAIIAHPNVKVASEKVGRIACLVGLCVILASMTLITPAMVFPGWLALFPCVGAAMVLWGGWYRPPPVLCVPPLVWIGRISFSLYLYHWPIFVFGKRLFPYVDVNQFAALGICLSIVASAVSYYFIEQPLRTGGGRRALAGAASLYVSSLVLALIVLGGQGFPARIDAQVANIAAYSSYDHRGLFRSRVCFLDPDQRAREINLTTCLPGNAGIVLWGDSHIAQFSHGLQIFLAHRNIVLGQLTASACPPIVGLSIPARPNCEEFNDRVIALLVQRKPETVVLGAVWTGAPTQLVALDRTIAMLTGAGIKVVVLGPAPIFKQPVPTILARRMQSGDPTMAAGPDMETVVFDRDRAVRLHLAGREDVRFISIVDAVCRERQCPLVYAGVPLHFDIAHVTREGSKYYGNIIAVRILGGDIK